MARQTIKRRMTVEKALRHIATLWPEVADALKAAIFTAAKHAQKQLNGGGQLTQKRLHRID